MNLSSKEKIILNSVTLFSQKGFDKTSIQAIADKTGVAQTSILYHYKNKALLFEACLDYVIKNNRSHVDADAFSRANPYEKLIMRLRSNAKWALDFPEQAGVLMLLFTFASSDKELKNNATKILDSGRALALEHLMEIHEYEPIKSSMSIERLSEILQQYVNAVVFQILCRNDSRSVYEKFISDLEPMVDSLLNRNN